MMMFVVHGKDENQRLFRYDDHYGGGYALFDCDEEKVVESFMECRGGKTDSKKKEKAKEVADMSPPKRTIGAMAKGIVGAVKAEAKIDKPSDELVAERYKICVSCETNRSGICSGKGGCGCWIAPKIRIKKESCPRSKW